MDHKEIIDKINTSIGALDGVSTEGHHNRFLLVLAVETLIGLRDELVLCEKKVPDEEQEE